MSDKKKGGGFAAFANSMAKRVREKDLFGHNISLNFNRRGHTHKTAVGGFFSLIVKMII